MEPNQVVSQEEWLDARRALLAQEKAFTHARDALTDKRRQMPWMKVDKQYSFDTAQGRKTLAELFDGRSQLIVYHFMLGPQWNEGCIGCSFLSDHIDGALPHLQHHDVSYVAVSRAPLVKIQAFKERMGWRFPWVSSNESDFNFDYHVSFSPDDEKRGRVNYNFEEQDYSSDELPGVSVFFKDDAGRVYHTYSAYARGAEMAIGAYALLEWTPKGRNEAENLGEWVRHHDKYEAAHSNGCCAKE